MRILLALLLLSSYVLSQDLDIKEAYNKVLLNNDSLKASYSAKEKAEKLKDSAYMLFAPSIDIVGNYTYMQKTSIEIPSFELTLPIMPTTPIQTPPMDIALHKNHFAFGIVSIMYPLYTGGKRLSAINLSKLNIQDAEFATQLNKINLFEKLIKAYYGLQLATEAYKTLHEAENGALNHLNNAISLEANGQIAKIEHLSAQVEYDKAKNKAHQAKDALDIALLAFKTILQDEEIAKSVELDNDGNITNLNLISKLDISTKDLESLSYYENLALSSYPALKNIEVKKEQAKEVSRLEFANFMPSVGLYGGYVIKDNNTILSKTIPSWYVGIGAKLSILSPNGRIFKYQASKIAQTEVDYLHKQAQKDISLLVETTYKEVLSAKNSYQNQRSTIALASENLKLQDEAFKNGMASNTQVSDARNQLSFAKIEAQNSAYKYILALAKLYAITNNIDGFYAFYE